MSEISKNIKVCDHPLIKHKVTLLRSRNIAPNQFRTLMREISYVAFPFFIEKTLISLRLFKSLNTMCLIVFVCLSMYIYISCVDVQNLPDVAFLFILYFRRNVNARSFTHYHSRSHIIVWFLSTLTISIEYFSQPKDCDSASLSLSISLSRRLHKQTHETNTHTLHTVWHTYQTHTTCRRSWNLLKISPNMLEDISQHVGRYLPTCWKISSNCAHTVT